MCLMGARITVADIAGPARSAVNGVTSPLHSLEERNIKLRFVRQRGARSLRSFQDAMRSSSARASRSARMPMKFLTRECSSRSRTRGRTTDSMSAAFSDGNRSSRWLTAMRTMVASSAPDDCTTPRLPGRAHRSSEQDVNDETRSAAWSPPLRECRSERPARLGREDPVNRDRGFRVGLPGFEPGTSCPPDRQPAQLLAALDRVSAGQAR